MADENSEPRKEKKRLSKGLRVTALVMAITAVIVTLLVIFVFPVMRIYGNSMSPVLFDGDIIVVYKTKSLDRGDICVFHMDDSFLCKRVIGVGGDEINIDENGTVYVNGTKLDEPYLSSTGFGNSTVTYPVVVPKNSYFMIGDNRRTSVDSRNTAVGCVNSKQVVGKVLLRILPIPEILK